MAKQTKKTDADKPWNRRTGRNKPYQMGSRNQHSKRFLIICEGKNTEPCYFESFPVLTAEVETFGTGRSKTSLVQYAKERASQEKPDPNREIWVVFDMDYSPLKEASIQKNDFNQAIQLAQKQGFKVAYSNDAFELWFILHYQFIDSALTRVEYYERLGQLWEISYERNGKGLHFCRGIYHRLVNDPKASLDDALRNAERLHFQNERILPADQNPCTTVYQLVAELIKHLKK